jgi:hypothetical protein
MRTNAEKLELLSMGLMVFGVIALCQPWSLFLHSYGATIILAGLIMFNIFSRVRPSKTRPSPGPDKASAERKPNQSFHRG